MRKKSNKKMIKFVNSRKNNVYFTYSSTEYDRSSANNEYSFDNEIDNKIDNKINNEINNFDDLLYASQLLVIFKNS